MGKLGPPSSQNAEELPTWMSSPATMIGQLPVLVAVTSWLTSVSMGTLAAKLTGLGT